MNERQALMYARAVVTQFELDQAHWKVVIDRRPVSRLGQCRYMQKEIGLSAHLIRDYDDDGVIDTIVHEVAHALVGSGHGHDAVWRRKYRELGGIGNKAVKADKRVRPKQYKWTGTCRHCGAEFPRHKLTKNTRLYGGCPKCKVVLTWKENY